jgi:hypothetical protein
MCCAITIDDAINIVRVVGDERAEDGDKEISDLALAAKRLVRHIEEQCQELERERARQYGLGRGDSRRPEFTYWIVG